MSIPDQWWRTVLRVFGFLPRRARYALVRFATPTYTAGAACLLEDDTGRLLFVLHPYRRLWAPPGGLLEVGEQPHETAVREMAEEIGIDVEPTGPPAVAIQAERRHIDFVFRVRATKPDQTPAPNSPEIDAVAWFALDQLPPLDAETVETLVVAGYRPGTLDDPQGA